MAIEQPELIINVNIPLDTKICDISVYLTTNHGQLKHLIKSSDPPSRISAHRLQQAFANSYGVKLHGQAEEITTSTYVKPPDAATVVTGSSYSGADKPRLTISQDEPLICFSDKVYHEQEIACSSSEDELYLAGHEL